MQCKELRIDELKICYTAVESTLLPLINTKIGESQTINVFNLYRLVNDRFKYFFEIRHRGRTMGQSRFGLYTDRGGEIKYVYLKMNNRVLYDSEALHNILRLPDALNLKYNNFTALDLAFDTSLNLPSMIKRLLRRKDITTIVNGKAIRKRNRVLETVDFDYSTTLDRLCNPSITFKQQKALAKKSEGITVQAYNKRAEIENKHPEKQYILDLCGNPKRLYRMEVRLHYQELKDYLGLIPISTPTDLIDNPTLLWNLYCYHLASVIRFTKGRRRLNWEELLIGNGKV